MELQLEQEPQFKEKTTINLHVRTWITQSWSFYPLHLLSSPTGPKYPIKYLCENQIQTTIHETYTVENFLYKNYKDQKNSANKGKCDIGRWFI